MSLMHDDVRIIIRELQFKLRLLSFLPSLPLQENRFFSAMKNGVTIFKKVCHLVPLIRSLANFVLDFSFLDFFSPFFIPTFFPTFFSTSCTVDHIHQRLIHA